jgi:hypothetical protein
MGVADLAQRPARRQDLAQRALIDPGRAREVAARFAAELDGDGSSR